MKKIIAILICILPFISKGQVINSMPEYNVKQYGLVDDSATDNTTALRALRNAIPVKGAKLYFPGGGKGYLFTDSIIFTSNIIIMGDGYSAQPFFTVNRLPQIGATNLFMNSATKTLFYFDSSLVNKSPIWDVEKLTIKNVSSSTPTAGSAIASKGNIQNGILRDVTTIGFYIAVDVVSSVALTFDNNRFYGPVFCCVRLNNVIENDDGAFNFVRCMFFSPLTASHSNGVIFNTGGAVRFISCDWNAQGDENEPTNFDTCLVLNFTHPTSDIQVADCFFENFKYKAISCINSTNSVCGNIQFNNLEIAPINDSGTALEGIYIHKFTGVLVSGIVGVNYFGSIPHPLVKIDSSTGVRIGQLMATDYVSTDSVYTSTNVEYTVLTGNTYRGGGRISVDGYISGNGNGLQINNNSTTAPSIAWNLGALKPGTTNDNNLHFSQFSASAWNDVATMTGTNFSMVSGNSVNTIGNGQLAWYKDATPSVAFASGMAVPGIAVGNNLIFSHYNGSAWSGFTSLFANNNFSIGSLIDSTGFLQIGAANTTTNPSMWIKGSAVDISSPKQGQLWYNASLHALNFYDNGVTTNLLNSGGYTLPTASTSVLGGVKVDGVSILISGGVISSVDSGSSANDGSLTITRTAINDDFKINTAHANTFSVAQTMNTGITLPSTGSARSVNIEPFPSTLDSLGFAMIRDTTTGPNAATGFGIVPKGVGYSNGTIASTFWLDNTDTYISPSNFTRLQVLGSAGNPFKIYTTNGGTGTLLPLTLQTGTNTNQMELLTNGNVSFAGTILPNAVEMVGATDVVYYKDATPTLAFGTSMNIPGQAVTNNFILSHYNGSAWSGFGALFGTNNFSIGSVVDSAAVIQVGLANTTTNASMWFKGSAVNVSSPVNGMLWYNSTAHTFNFRDNGTTYNLLAGGSANTLSNNGSGFRFVQPISGSNYPIRTLFGGSGILVDSSSNTNALTLKADTSLIATQYDISNKPSVVGSIDLGTVTSAQTNFLIFTAPGSGTHNYEVSGYINSISGSLDVLSMIVTYQDEFNATKSSTFYSQGSSTSGIAIGTYSSFPPIRIHVYPGSQISVSTVLTTGGGTVAYDLGASILQIN